MIVEPSHSQQTVFCHSITEIRHKENSNVFSSLSSLQDKDYSCCGCLLYPFKKIAEFFQWIFCKLFRDTSSEQKTDQSSSKEISETHTPDKNDLHPTKKDLFSVPHSSFTDNMMSCPPLKKTLAKEDVLALLKLSTPYYYDLVEKLTPEDLKNLNELLESFKESMVSYLQDSLHCAVDTFCYTVKKIKTHITICELKLQSTGKLYEIAIGNVNIYGKNKQTEGFIFPVSRPALVEIFKGYLYQEFPNQVLGTQTARGEQSIFIYFKDILRNIPINKADIISVSGEGQNAYIYLPGQKKGVLSQGGLEEKSF